MNKKTFDTKNQFAGNHTTANKTGGYTAPTAGGLKHDQTRHTNTNLNRPTTPTAKTVIQPTQQGGWKDKKGGGTCR